MLAVALLWPANALAGYGWPIKPFDQQHPIRGGFGDPRFAGGGGPGTSFHFGVDISARDGTPIYATISGTIYVEEERPQTVSILAADGLTAFSYWHINPTVATGEAAVAGVTVLGRIASGWGHVHFSEVRGGIHLNPLRAGALTPYLDVASPAIGGITFERGRKRLAPLSLRGSVDIVADAFDLTSLSPPRPWARMPVTPALLRWRVRRGARTVLPWQTIVDFRSTVPPEGSFAALYASGTRQNRTNRPGSYRFFLARRWDTRTLPDAEYRLEVAVEDLVGNRASATLSFTTLNSS